MNKRTRTRVYRYPVANGIRFAMISLARHIPSQILVAGNRELVSYDGQPMTYYGCNEAGHLYHVCAMRRRVWESVPTAAAASWTGIAAGGTGKTRIANDDTEGTVRQCGHAGSADRKYGERDDQPTINGKVATHDDHEKMNETLQAVKCSRHRRRRHIRPRSLGQTRLTKWSALGRNQGKGMKRRMFRHQQRRDTVHTRANSRRRKSGEVEKTRRRQVGGGRRAPQPRRTRNQ